ncbi:MAG: ABC-2 family transporter protein [Chloroflexi bacterium]|nr:ABC-2 family transporter protein [Chloroflexota bacterium]
MNHNHQGGLALIRATWLSWMQHRSFFFILAFGWMMQPLIFMFVWATAAGDQTIGGLTRGEIVAYYLTLILVNQITYSQTNWTVGDLIRGGDMNRLLLLPMSPLYNTLASELAGKVVYLTFVLPIVLLLTLLLKPAFNLTAVSLFAFLPALLLAWLLRFLWGYALALLAFWAARADALLAVQDALVFLLAGQAAPTLLLPPLLRTLAVILPFRYMVGFPAEVLTGQLNGTQLTAGFVAQIGWLAVTLLLYQVMWRRGVRQYTAVGG